ncbi:hypothetical protein LshimejAT787_0905400 [Lyophyllum shimeji]|uniref:Uncharacterized protein n=1 Tax=Lyophyllum shimeji TaxID=47721 RepID=A0A9P3PRD9_LYOSH|nr:hypothetical protein LshimejAT787_0905400 [Lyophyllum shimeji]
MLGILRRRAYVRHEHTLDRLSKLPDGLPVVYNRIVALTRRGAQVHEAGCPVEWFSGFVVIVVDDGLRRRSVG